MNASLDDQIRTSLEAIAARTTIDDDARFGERTVAVRPAPRRSPVLALAAAAAVIVAVVGVAVVTHNRPSTGTGSIGVDAGTPAVGLFPPGDVDAVVAAGYATPQAAAEAYLADRTRKEVLPAGFTATGTLNSQSDTLNDREVLLSFSLATTDDTGDGVMLVRQVAPNGQPPRWVVAGAGIGSLTIDELDHTGAGLRGSYTAGAGDGQGRSQLDVYDAVTGERLASTTDNPFTLPDVGTGSLAVRVWNYDGGGYPIAVLAEVLVRPGETLRGQGFPALQARTIPSTPSSPDVRLDATMSAFDRLAVGASAPVVTQDGLTIAIRRADDIRPLCVDIAFGGQPTIPTCFERDLVATPWQTVFTIDSLDGTKVLVGGVVPDAITAVVGVVPIIAPVDNVWWQVIDAGVKNDYTFTTATGGVGTIKLG